MYATDPKAESFRVEESGNVSEIVHGVGRLLSFALGERLVSKLNAMDDLSIGIRSLDDKNLHRENECDVVVPVCCTEPFFIRGHASVRRPKCSPALDPSTSWFDVSSALRGLRFPIHA